MAKPTNRVAFLGGSKLREAYESTAETCEFDVAICRPNNIVATMRDLGYKLRP